MESRPSRCDSKQGERFRPKAGRFVQGGATKPLTLRRARKRRWGIALKQAWTRIMIVMQVRCKPLGRRLPAADEGTKPRFSRQLDDGFNQNGA